MLSDPARSPAPLKQTVGQGEGNIRAFLGRTPTRPDLRPVSAPAIDQSMLEDLAAFARGGRQAASGVVTAPIAAEVTQAIEDSLRALDQRDVKGAFTAAERVVSACGGSPEAAEFACRERGRSLLGVYQAALGDRGRLVRTGRGVPGDARSAYLLSRVDGSFSIDDLIAISGMGRHEATRAVAILLRDGVLSA